jgi:nucleoside-diphosphate-sugar epimerase
VAALVSHRHVESALIVRLYNAFGPGERPGRLIPRVVEAARTKRSFVLTGDPSSLSDPIHVDDVVRCLLAAAQTSVEGTYDLCGGDPVPLAARVDRIARMIGAHDLPIVVSPHEGETPIGFYSDPGPLCSALGVPSPERFDSAARRYAVAEGWIAG